MKRRTAIPLLVVLNVLLFGLYSSIYAQTRKGFEPLPKRLPVREQKLVRETWLKNGSTRCFFQ